jgi:hypothetical protein
MLLVYLLLRYFSFKVLPSSGKFRLVGGGVQLGPLGTAATNWPIAAWRIWWNEDWQGKPKYSEKTRPSATLSITNHTWLDPGTNPGRRGGKSATNRLSYGAALGASSFFWLSYSGFRVSCYNIVTCYLTVIAAQRLQWKLLSSHSDNS